MNTERIVWTLQEQYPGRKIITLPDDNPTEIICESEPPEEHPDYSVAISVLRESVPHKHNKATETYRILKGELVLHLGEQAITMHEGDTQVIEPGIVHWATSEEAWIHVEARPGWTPEDHIIVDIPQGTERAR